MRNRIHLIALVALASACISINNNREIFEDEQVAMVLRTAHVAEVREGTLAREKAAEPRVRDFASMMVSEHGLANSRMESEFFKENIASTDSPVSRQLDAESGAATERLRGLSGRAFDRAYMERQVQVHQSMVSLIDTKLTGAAREKVVKEHLAAMKATLQTHLTQAQQVLASLP